MAAIDDFNRYPVVHTWSYKLDKPMDMNAALQAAPNSGERALEHFLAAGFRRIEPAVLHPASIFLDLSGEEIRGRLFLTAGAAGQELCLRPEYTIPVCRAYLSSDMAGRVAEYAYFGPVFRSQAEGGERLQTGLESFGRKDAEAADAEIFALSMEAAAAAAAPLSCSVGRCGAVRQPARSARSARHLAPASEARRGARARPFGHSRRAWPKRACAAGRAGGAGERGPRRRQGAGRGSAGDRRHSTRSAGAPLARSPTGFWSRPRCGPGSRSTRRSERCWNPILRYRAIPTRPL